MLKWRYVETMQDRDYYCAASACKDKRPLFNCCDRGAKFDQNTTGGYYCLESLMSLKRQRYFTTK
jgi:hypothetical protein